MNVESSTVAVTSVPENSAGSTASANMEIYEYTLQAEMDLQLRTIPVEHPPKSLTFPKIKTEIIYGVAAWLVLAVFFAAQIPHILLVLNGAFFDEGIYITAGLRVWQGYGFSDNYLTWFAGSLVWPALAGLGYNLSGLAGARLIALLCVTLGLAGTVRAAQNMFGNSAAFWTATTLALNGPVIALSQLAVYDSLALAGIGISFGAITELAKRDHRFWLLVAILGFNLAVFAKYPIALCGLPLLGVLFALRGKKAKIDLFVISFMGGSILMLLYIPLRYDLAAFIQWRIQNNPNFGATPTTVQYSMFYLNFVPGLLGLAGWIASAGQRRLATVLFSALFLWPLYHILSSNSVSSEKHIVFGYLFCFPLIGLALSKVSRPLAGKVISVGLLAALALFGQLQSDRLQYAWPDTRPVAQYLGEHISPKDQILASNSWAYTLFLYSQQSTDSPWNIADVSSTIPRTAPTSICDYDWIVEDDGSYAFSANLKAEMLECGTFQKVFTFKAEVVNMGQSLEFINSFIHTTVWQRVKP